MLISRTSSGRGEFAKLLAAIDGAFLITATFEKTVLSDIIVGSYFDRGMISGGGCDCVRL